VFDRGNSGAAGPLCVEITLQDGRELHGKLIVPVGRTLAETLNGGSAFVEFEPVAGERMFIARAALQSVKAVDIPAAPRLSAGNSDEGFNPRAILGVGADATPKQVREAYLTLAKIYHPDRHAASDLPVEVREYLAAMARRINAAHDALEATHQRRGAKQEAVFTKAGSQ